MMKILKVLMVAAAAAGLVGCASLDGFVQAGHQDGHRLSADGSGTVVGVVGYHNHKTSDVCKTAQSADPRCTEPDKWKARGIAGRFGFSDGAQGLIVLMPADTKLEKEGDLGCDDCTYLKVKAEPNRFATLLEVLPVGVCHWEGGNKAGGAVCPSLGWDYRKDLVDYNVTHK